MVQSSTQRYFGLSRWPQFSPDGRRILVASMGDTRGITPGALNLMATIFDLKSDGRPSGTLWNVNFGALTLCPRWRPDGKAILITQGARDNRLQEIDLSEEPNDQGWLDGKTIGLATPADKYIHAFPAYAPKTRHVAFSLSSRHFSVREQVAPLGYRPWKDRQSDRLAGVVRRSSRGRQAQRLDSTHRRRLRQSRRRLVRGAMMFQNCSAVRFEPLELSPYRRHLLVFVPGSRGQRCNILYKDKQQTINLMDRGVRNMPTELAKQYDPHEAQKQHLQFWEERGYFHSRPDPNREPFCIVIPPPNVTGALHLGHALNNTLQDVLIRWRRMQGRNALWMPGTDHAGIATQAVVERRIRDEEGKTRHDVGREELVKRIWQWKDQYEKRILDQLRQLGCSCDWARTRFTLDPICARAVRQTFFRFFRDGLIVRGKRLVNWDTQLQTAVADDEIFHETVKGGFWTFRYPVKGANDFIRFSTTRPETMLGDTAVAVHPEDERFKHLIGKMVTVPLVNRDIPIISDAELVDPKLGTGAVKVTPAHDANDYACGLRHNLPMINILNPNGTINENGGRYAGLDRYKAREQVTEEMEKLGLFDGKEDREIELAHSDRSKSPIEPYLSDQWFLKMSDLAQTAMDAVAPPSPPGTPGGEGRGEGGGSGRETAIPLPSPPTPLPGYRERGERAAPVQFFPPRYAKTYLDWLGEKRDWCISRQLWWGHRIPIWYVRCPESELKKAFAGRDDVTWKLDDENGQWLVCGLDDIPANALGDKYPLEQDADVLDTWFSSALWPHSTLGWPEMTPELAYYYPTSVLVTNRDIITLWVARMVITGLYNMSKVPFHHVYIHPKVLDGFGEGMSKSKGNGIDPLDIIARYGADALRYGMVNVATETQDSRMPVSNVCPHCDKLIAVKQEHMYMRTKKLTCPECKKVFRPGGPWTAEDAELKTAKQASDRFEMGRNFANKIWNAARFILRNLEGYTPQAVAVDQLPIEDRWILSRLASTTEAATAQLEGYQFAEYGRTIYEFVWTEFCDWYIEMSKDRLRPLPSSPSPSPSPSPPTPLPEYRERGEAGNAPRPLGERGWGEGAASASAQRVLVGVLDGILRLVQPVMPFVAESIWQALGEIAFERGLPAPDPVAESVVIAAWPQYPEAWKDAGMEKRIANMQELVRAVRETRNRYMVDPKTGLEVYVKCNQALAADFRSLEPFIKTLASVSRLDVGPQVQKPPQSGSHVTPEFEVYVSLAGLIDVAAEIKRLEKQIAEKSKFLQGTRSKLANENFVKNAPEAVVQQQRELIADLEKQIVTMEANLRELQG